MSETPPLKEATAALAKALGHVTQYFADLDTNDVPTLLKAFKGIHEASGLIEELFKIVKSIEQKCSYETIPNTFESHGFDSVKSQGRNFVVSVRTNASIPLDMREKGHQWLKDNNMSYLIVPTVNPKSLSSFIKAYTQEKGLIPPDDCIKIHSQKYTSIRQV